MQEYPKESRIFENKRVILITGDSSKWYEQAIFIVKKNLSPKNVPMDLITEAESIIESYMSGVVYDGAKNYKSSAVRITESPHAPQKNKRSTLDIMLNFIMLISCVAIFAILMVQFM